MTTPPITPRDSSPLGRWQVWHESAWIPLDLRWMVGQPTEDDSVAFQAMPGAAAYSKGVQDQYVLPDPSFFEYKTFHLNGWARPDPPTGGGAWHGEYGPVHGNQYGFAWLPPLPSPYRCVNVRMTWVPTHLYNPTFSRIAIGYHAMPKGTGAININDPRIMMHVYDESARIGQPITRMMDRAAPSGQSLVDLVNQYRDGSFGIVVGHNSDDPYYYGYGRITALTYFIEREYSWIL